MNPYEERNTQKALAMEARGCRSELEYFLMNVRAAHLTHQVTWQFSIWSTYYIKIELPDKSKLDIVVDPNGDLKRPIYQDDGEVSKKTEFDSLDAVSEYIHDLKIQKTNYSLEDATEYLKGVMTVKEAIEISSKEVGKNERFCKLSQRDS